MFIAPSATTLSKDTNRGAFILLEGIDRCGKTTQCGMLVKHLLSLSLAAIAIRFPDRMTPVGKVIDQYLQAKPSLMDGKKGTVDDRAIHLLFSANRWEAVPSLIEALGKGVHVVCDRYAYSGVAFSSAKDKSDMDPSTASAVAAMNSNTACIDNRNKYDLGMEWCISPDRGLPAPDVVIFLDLSQDLSEKRGGYGGERYEKRDLQLRVREKFRRLQEMDEKTQRVPWYIVDASKTVEEVQNDINAIVSQVLDSVASGKKLGKMFDEGSYHVQNSSSQLDQDL